MPLDTRRSSTRGFPWLLGEDGPSRAICSLVGQYRSLVCGLLTNLKQILTLAALASNDLWLRMLACKPRELAVKA
jgi:hypothetical protein